MVRRLRYRVERRYGKGSLLVEDVESAFADLR